MIEGCSPAFSLTMPPEMVVATLTERKAPAKFSTAAMATATLGLRAPVAMEVAIALAVSWKPFVKSKASAVMITTATRNVMCSIPKQSSKWSD